jgi:hypothetical protein
MKMEERRPTVEKLKTLGIISPKPRLAQDPTGIDACLLFHRALAAHAPASTSIAIHECCMQECLQKGACGT